MLKLAHIGFNRRQSRKKDIEIGVLGAG